MSCRWDPVHRCIVATEILLDDGDGLLVNAVVLVFLKGHDVIDAARFVNERDVSGDLVEGLSGLEGRLKGLEGDCNNPGVGRAQDSTDSQCAREYRLCKCWR